MQYFHTYEIKINRKLRLEYIEQSYQWIMRYPQKVTFETCHFALATNDLTYHKRYDANDDYTKSIIEARR